MMRGCRLPCTETTAVRQSVQKPWELRSVTEWTIAALSTNADHSNDPQRGSL